MHHVSTAFIQNTDAVNPLKNRGYAVLMVSFKDLLNAIRKEAMSNMIKASIRQQFHEPFVSTLNTNKQKLKLK